MAADREVDDHGLEAAADLTRAQARVDDLFPGSSARHVPTPPVRKLSTLGKREAIIGRVEAGETIASALASLGISQKSHEYYRRTDPSYRARIDVARRQTAQTNISGPTWEGDSASFNETYFPMEFPTPAFHMEMQRKMKAAKPGSIVLINCFPNSGKGLALDTPLATPDGWTTMGEIQVGDRLFDENGDTCTVTYVSPVWSKPCFEVRFSIGETIVCDEDHLWLTEARSDRNTNRPRSVVRPITEIADSVIKYDRPNHRVRLNAGLQMPDADLPIDPYVLGVWLGDGHSDSGRITSGSQDVAELTAILELAGEVVGARRDKSCWTLTCHRSDTRPALATRLRSLDLLGNKHIPAAYLRSSYKQRLALLQGLMDTDGSCSNGMAEFSSTKLPLAAQFVELCNSLGVKASMCATTASVNGKDCGLVYRVQFPGSDDLAVFRLQRKLARLQRRVGDRRFYTTIESVSPVPSVPTRCIQVDSPSHLFLAGQWMIPTHNTAIIENFICETLATDPNHRFVVASKAQNHARKLLATVKDRMTNIAAYPGYIGRFGPFYIEGQERSGKPWTTDYIKVAKFDSGERDYSVQTMGWSGQILGSRVDTIILDDIQTGDNLSQVEEMLRKFRQDFYTRLKGGRIIIIGNRIANGDFYERLIDLDIVEPENHWDFPALDHEGNSLWPDRWPVDELAQMRRVVGENIWWTTYQQKPQLASNATFDESMVEKSKDWGRKVGRITPGKPTLLSIDPGLDPGVTAITCIQYDASTIDVIDAEKHGDFTQQEQIIDLIESYAIRYSPQHVVIETVAFQRALERDDRLQALGRKYGFLTHAHNTGKNKADPIMGVAAMASSFIREEITFPWEGGDGSISAARFEPFLAELRAWRPNVPTKLITQDFVMSLWFGWKWLMESRHGMGIASDAWRRPSHLPWRGTSAPRIQTSWLRSVS